MYDRAVHSYFTLLCLLGGPGACAAVDGDGPALGGGARDRFDVVLDVLCAQTQEEVETRLEL